MSKFNIEHCFDEGYYNSVIERARARGTIKRFVNEIIIEGLDVERLQDESKSGEQILYASNHKSHLDYIILGEIIHRNKLPTPRYAAGHNLLAWPISSLIDFRRMGAFSIDRKNKSQEYLRNLYKYIQDLTTNGENILFFPEGGRSYNESYMKPKTGLVRTVLEAIEKQERAGRKIKVNIVPIHIDYDSVIEKDIFPLLDGAKKIPIIGTGLYYSLDLFAFAKRYFSTKKGNVYVKFGDSINIRNLGTNKKQIADRIMELIKWLGEKEHLSF